MEGYVESPSVNGTETCSKLPVCYIPVCVIHFSRQYLTMASSFEFVNSDKVGFRHSIVPHSAFACMPSGNFCMPSRPYETNRRFQQNFKLISRAEIITKDLNELFKDYAMFAQIRPNLRG